MTTVKHGLTWLPSTSGWWQKPALRFPPVRHSRQRRHGRTYPSCTESRSSATSWIPAIVSSNETYCSLSEDLMERSITARALTTTLARVCGGRDTKSSSIRWRSALITRRRKAAFAVTERGGFIGAAPGLPFHHRPRFTRFAIGRAHV